MDSFSRLKDFTPPFIGPDQPFQGPFTTSPAALPMVSQSPSAPSNPPSANPTSSPAAGSKPSPGPDTNSSPRPFFSRENSHANAIIAIMIVGVAIVVIASVIGCYHLIRRHRASRRAAWDPSTPRDGNGAPGNTGWFADLEAARENAVQEQLRAYYGHLREQGLNELGEAPPPYKPDPDADSPYSLPHEPPMATAPPYSPPVDGFELATLHPVEQQQPSRGAPKTVSLAPPPPAWRTQQRGAGARPWPPRPSTPHPRVDSGRPATPASQASSTIIPSSSRSSSPVPKSAPPLLLQEPTPVASAR